MVCIILMLSFLVAAHVIRSIGDLLNPSIWPKQAKAEKTGRQGRLL